MKNNSYLMFAMAFLMAISVKSQAADDSQSAEIEALRQLQARIDALERKLSEKSLTAPTRERSTYMNSSFMVMMDAGWSTDEEPSERLQLGDHDPLQRGFSLRNAEIAFDGAVDPYFKGFGNIVLKLDEENETEIELEEAYLLSTALPANLQLKVGQFFAEFGRQNSQHPHAWAFVDAPLILNRVFGPEGLRNIGARISWLAPTPFYTEFMLGVFNGNGGTAYSFRNDEAEFYGHEPVERGLEGAEDMLFVPRISSSFDLTPAQTLVLGASAALGPNSSGEDAHTQIYGIDAYWKWKPANANAGFPFVSWQTELLSRRFEAAEGESEDGDVIPAKTLTDWGYYSQILWGFHSRWVLGLRGEQVWANDDAVFSEESVRGDRTRISPNITFLPSEFSKFRLQYNFDDISGGDEHSIWLRMEFSLGAHAAHKF